MNLRHKLTYLHTTFAVFAVVAASAIIYGVRLYVREAVQRFERVSEESSIVDQLRVDVSSQLVALYDIADGRRELNSFYKAERDAFLTQLSEVTGFESEVADNASLQSIQDIAQDLRKSFYQVEQLVRQGQRDQANSFVSTRIESDLLVALDLRLQTLNAALKQSRRQSVDRVLVTNAQLLGLTGVVAVSCVGLVIVGVFLVRRWLINPIMLLHEATREFAEGNLNHRVKLDTADELTSLGSAMNTMAVSLGESNRKYRALFENQQDAMVICDAAGRVVECHDGETRLLGDCAGQAVGRHLLDVWPEWKTSAWDWNDVVSRVATTGRQIKAVDRRLNGESEKETIVDLVVYPVEYADCRYSAIVLRDVTERHGLQRMQSRAETMEAAVTFARGIAHDFKNLLHSAVTALSLIKPDEKSAKDAERVQTALSACEQAAGLSRKLLNFASSDEGQPETLDLSETVELILGSLDEVLLSKVQFRTKLAGNVKIFIDRDQLTQVILNLVRNACEAMPDGGDLSITTALTRTVNPFTVAKPAHYAVLIIIDSGCGMSDQTLERLFEPLYSTKPRGSSGVRGMGLAVVYAAVRNAGGFIHVDSQVDRGTTFHVYLPAAEERHPAG